MSDNKNTVFVGSLPYSATSEEITELFSNTVSIERVNLILDENGRSKGFAFVDMTNEEDVDKAIDAFNGYELGGRTLVVNRPRPRTGGSDRGGFGGNRGGFNRR